ncbi:MAG TPA: DUF58 domain-containing protein [Gemmatimonadaceae bacterium]|nr:DUF58 domain-containing protein [Gemmatimonadaceae bacterium]
MPELRDDFAALFDAVRGIRWPARGTVRGGIPGAHTSRLRGISAEFSEYRPYRQGDDPRRVDWKLFARTDRAYIRLSNDRAILPTMIVLDASASMAFPVDTLGKWRFAAQVAVGLCAVARNAGDPVGIAIAGVDDPALVPPRTRRGAVQEIVRTIAETAPSGRGATASVLSVAAQSAGRLAIVSDFLGDFDEIVVTAGRLVAAGRELHAIHVVAADELDPPQRSSTVTDPEHTSIRRALTGATRDAYLAAFRDWRERVAHDLADVGVSYSVAVVGEESTEHLIRRITAPRGVSAIA